MADHQHIYVVGESDPPCQICRERRSASELDLLNALVLAEHTARAVALMRSELQRIEDEAADRLHHAEWKDGA